MEEEVMESEGKRVVFGVTERISTYVMAVACGDFCETTDLDFHVPLCLAYRHSMSRFIPISDIFHYTRTCIDYYESLFHYPLPFPHYTQILVPEMYMGAMENAACVIINDNNLWKETPTRSESLYFYNTILHELSHMWFGNLVTFQWWDDIWLNESFATYISYLALEEAFHQEVWPYFYLYCSRGFALDIMDSTHPVHIDIEDTAQAQSSFDAITYSKGAAIIKSLVSLVGKDAFFEGLERYFRKYQWSNVTMRELMSTLQEGTGKDLGRWVEDWVETAGVNQLSYAPPNLYQHSFPSSSHTLRSHQVSLKHFHDPLFYICTETTYHLPAVPHCTLPSSAYFTFLGLDFSDYLLISYPPSSLQILESLSICPLNSPSERSVLWTHLWYMLQTFDLSSIQYISLAQAWLLHESSEDITDFVLRTLYTAIFSYLPDDLISQYADMCLEMVKNRLLLSDETLKFVYKKRITSFAYSEKAVNLLLNEKKALHFSRTQKWHLIMTQSAFLSLNEVKTELETELEGDEDSDMGRRLRYYCEASAWDNKAQTWRVITTQAEEYSLPEYDLILEGFNRQVQRELVSPYRHSILPHLHHLITSHQQERTESFLESMLPLDLTSTELKDWMLSSQIAHYPWAKDLVNKTANKLEIQEKAKNHTSRYLAQKVGR